MTQGSPFRRLGLSEDASLQQVKRAYAVLLRKHRPDEDPQGFQWLHEAYAACMDHVHWREQAWHEDDHGDATEPAVAVADTLPADAVFAPFDPDALDAAPPFQDNAANEPADEDDAGFDVEAFAQELVGRMRNDAARAVDAWLSSNDWLYSVDRKQALQPIVVQALAGVEPAIAAEHFDSLTRFFALDTVGIDGWLRHQLDLVQRRIHDASRFEHQLRLHTSKHATWTDVQLAKELFGPPQWLRRLFLLLVPGLPGRLATLANNLHAASPEASEAQLHQPTCRFWDKGHRPGEPRPRTAAPGQPARPAFQWGDRRLRGRHRRQRHVRPHLDRLPAWGIAAVAGVRRHRGRLHPLPPLQPGPPVLGHAHPSGHASVR